MTESIQYERDLRSNNKEWRRTKDSAVKWSHGSRPLAGITVGMNYWHGPGVNGKTAPEHMFAKRRPEKKHSEHKRALNGYSPRHRVGLYTQADVLEATIAADDVPSTPGAVPPADAGVLYSFDRTDTPGRALALDVFVKTTNGGKETERLIEKEYEVLDVNGDAVRGRKAKAILRKGTERVKGNDTAAGGEGDKDGEEVEDGFELI
ncbi:hypothetical protein C7999DRAFT_17444 [Corynascus novoguineensis]|uniref:Uncharacterized protein n=1 Tax=Corynascus novoguineensis TaxID=1126955 RepID=A0AAN7CP42_9PEZI|nr:hypothetical protein C7999DRAFT_17444 [Corynascus novoguineensis]